MKLLEGKTEQFFSFKTFFFQDDFPVGVPRGAHPDYATAAPHAPRLWSRYQRVLLRPFTEEDNF